LLKLTLYLLLLLMQHQKLTLHNLLLKQMLLLMQHQKQTVH